MCSKATTCSRCGVVSRHFIHTVPHRGTFHHLCTNCVLRLHSHAFCPISFTLHTNPPPHTTPSCLKCSSIPHTHCVDPTSKPPYICPICINPTSPPFILQDSKPITIDLNTARGLLVAARIVSGLMNVAAVEARFKAEKRAVAAIISIRKAKMATAILCCVNDDSKCVQCGLGENAKDLILCDKCDKGFHLFCVRPVLGSVRKGSWFCANCSALIRNEPEYMGKAAFSNEVATNQKSSCLGTVAENKSLDNTELVGGQEKSNYNKTTHHTGLGSTKVFSRYQTDSSINTKGSCGQAALEDIGEWSSKLVQNTPKATFDREISGGSVFDEDGRSSPNALIKVLSPNRMDLPDMAVDEELLTEVMLRIITPPLSERARAGQPDRAEPFKKKETKHSTTKTVSKSKLVGEAEGEVEFKATGPAEEQMTENKEHADGGKIGGDWTEIPSKGRDEENEEGHVDPDAWKEKKGIRSVSPIKEKVGGGHRHKKHKESSSKGKKMRNKEAIIVNEKSPFVRSEDDDGGPCGRVGWLTGPFSKSMATEDDMVKMMEGGWEDHGGASENALARVLVKRANDCRAHCKKAEAELKGCEAQYDIMENQIKAAKRKVKDVKQQVDAAKKDTQIFVKDMKDFEDAAKKKEAELRTRNKELEQESKVLKKLVQRLSVELSEQKGIVDILSAKLDIVPSNAQVNKKYKQSLYSEFSHSKKQWKKACEDWSPEAAKRNAKFGEDGGDW